MLITSFHSREAKRTGKSKIFFLTQPTKDFYIARGGIAESWTRDVRRSRVRAVNISPAYPLMWYARMQR